MLSEAQCLGTIYGGGQTSSRKWVCPVSVATAALEQSTKGPDEKVSLRTAYQVEVNDAGRWRVRARRHTHCGAEGICEQGAAPSAGVRPT